MNENFISERGIYYRTNDFKEGRPTLVFMHGLSSSSSAWFAYEKIFKDDYNILEFDLRGHGESLKPPRYSDYEIRDSAQDLWLLVEKQSIDKFIIVSHSFSASIVLEFISQHKERVAAAIFLSPVFKVERILWVRAAHFFLGGLASLIRKFSFPRSRAKHVDYSKYIGKGDWNLGRLSVDIPNTSFHAYLYCLRHIYRFKGEKYLPELTMPVLIINGDKDTVIPARFIPKMIRQIKDCTHVLLEGANHMIVINNVPEVAGEIKKFIREKHLDGLEI
ncbi:MAG TPA: alpha/beta hydrolase [Candidatus Paceibacterota bacterium]|nr:alpha/beta hydrolase [Candidatus Paceibacterota bacterium]